MVQYSNKAKNCHQSEKDGTILKQIQSCHQSEKDGTILKQCKNLSPVTSNRAKTCQQSKKDGAILKQYQNLLTVRKRWYNTEIEPKPVTSQKRCKILKQCQIVSTVKKDGAILKQCQNLSPVKKDSTILKHSENQSTVRKRRYNTQTEPKPVTSQKKMVQYSNRA